MSVLVTSAVVVAPAPRARACVALIQEQGGVVQQGGQLAILSVHEDVTDNIFVIDVPAADNAFGVLIPVPAEPVISPEPVATDAIDALESTTRPLIVVGGAAAEDSGCGCARTLGGDALNDKGFVVEGEAVDIGPITAQWVSGTGGNDVAQWLADKGFVLPAGADAVLDDYTDVGMSFLAFTRNGTSAGPARVGVKFTLDGDRRVYALKMAKVGCAARMGFTVFVATASDAPVAPDAPFAQLSVRALGDTDGDYAGAVASLVAGEKAFVIETFGPVSNLPPAAAALFAPGAYVTRLSTVVDPQALDADVTFTATADDEPQAFTGLAAPARGPTVPRLDVSLSFLLVMLGARELRARSLKRASACVPVRA